jgi:hypothetical protein
MARSLPRNCGGLKRQGGQFFPGEEKLTGGIANLDDYSACEISQKRDWRDLFVTPFYFGCEADDPSNVWAFNARANPLGARLTRLRRFDPPFRDFHRASD